MALWDRMLRLPATFFRRYQVGDLADRSLVVNAVNEQVTDVVVISLIGGAFGSVQPRRHDHHQPAAWRIVGLLLCGVGAFVLFLTRRVGSKPWVDMLAGGPGDLRRGPAVLHRHREDPHVGLRAPGVLPLGAALRPAERARAEDLSTSTTSRVVFQASFRTSAILVLFIAIYFIGRESIEPAEFMGFYVAFGALLFAFFQISSSFATMLEAGPTLAQCRPILDTHTESDEPKQHPGTLSGRIEVRNVRFRYPDASDGPVRGPLPDDRTG